MPAWPMADLWFPCCSAEDGLPAPLLLYLLAVTDLP
jgi:hypothetical protein